MNFHGLPRGRKPGRCELFLCQYIHSDIQDEEWPRQTSGHGFWWLSSWCVSSQSWALLSRTKVRISKTWLVWFLRYVEYHEYWNETNEECRNPEETSAERFADRLAVIAGVQVRVGFFYELWIRTSSSQFVPPIPIMLRFRHIMLLTLLTIFCAFSVYLFFWPVHEACQTQGTEKNGMATIQQERLSEACRTHTHTHTHFFFCTHTHTHMFLHFCTHTDFCNCAPHTHFLALLGNDASTWDWNTILRDPNSLLHDYDVRLIVILRDRGSSSPWSSLTLELHTHIVGIPKSKWPMRQCLDEALKHSLAGHAIDPDTFLRDVARDWCR